MLERLRKARLLWPTLAALAGLAVLLGLGTWQMERKRWKEGLIATIAARVHADPVPLASVLGRTSGKDDLEYTHVSVSGRFHHDKERYLYAPTPAGQGWHVYTPLETAEGAHGVDQPRPRPRHRGRRRERAPKGRVRVRSRCAAW